jgi:hypothetical protein
MFTCNRCICTQGVKYSASAALIAKKNSSQSRKKQDQARYREDSKAVSLPEFHLTQLLIFLGPWKKERKTNHIGMPFTV